MNLELSPRAIREAERRDRWWRENRRGAPTLFQEELRGALAQIQREPESGRPYQAKSGREFYRVRTRRTLCYVYYEIRRKGIRVVALWSAVRPEPRL
ncbi:MAG TPA: type II toxin-antitoxin system RelE/ParE family toxin [Polyangiaceae bacterium]|nr:type II toxin-antitoxin system RelE/ParE family toxin [Polyangiaceae bacterium]